MNTVKLKNGAEEASALVAVTMMTINSLFEEYPMVPWDLVMLCRDKTYKPFGVAEKVLRERALIGADNHIHSSIRNIVLSAASGEGLEMTFGDPVKR